MFKNLGNTHNWIHVLMIGPLLTYIGQNKEKTDEKYYNYLLILSIMMLFMIRVPLNFKSLDYHTSIKIVHYLIWLPLFIYIALKKNQNNKIVYEMLKIIGISAFSYHSYKLVNKYFM